MGYPPGTYAGSPSYLSKFGFALLRQGHDPGDVYHSIRDYAPDESAAVAIYKDAYDQLTRHKMQELIEGAPEGEE